MVRISNDLIHPTKHDTTFYVFLDFTNTIALDFWANAHSPRRMHEVLLLDLLEYSGKEGYISETSGPL